MLKDHTMMRLAVGRPILVLVPAPLFALFVQDSAAATDELSSTNGKARDGQDYVVDVLFGTNGEVIRATAFDADGKEIPIPEGAVVQTKPSPSSLEFLLMHAEEDGGTHTNATGGGGSSGPTGCRSVTVSNEKESMLGFTLFWFHTKTEWCWTSSTYTIHNVILDWWFTDVDPFWSFQGLTRNHYGFYQYVAGRSLSGYFHDKQAHFQSCIWIVCQNSYPRNQLWSFYNGAYQWRTDD